VVSGCFQIVVDPYSTPVLHLIDLSPFQLCRFTVLPNLSPGSCSAKGIISSGGKIGGIYGTLSHSGRVCVSDNGGWNLRVWNYPNGGSGQFPNFDFVTKSFNIITNGQPQSFIIDKTVPNGMVFNDAQWNQLGAPNDNFAAVLTGFLNVNVAGLYNFWTESDDGSSLWIDSGLVVDNGGTHAIQKRQGTVSLSRGFHSILVQFFEAGGGAFLKISYSGADTGGAEQPVPVQPVADSATVIRDIRGALDGSYLSYSDGLDSPNTLPDPDEWTVVCATSRTDSPVLVNGIERSRSC
jgi:hypothetical protein